MPSRPLTTLIRIAYISAFPSQNNVPNNRCLVATACLWCPRSTKDYNTMHVRIHLHYQRRFPIHVRDTWAVHSYLHLTERSTLYYSFLLSQTTSTGDCWHHLCLCLIDNRIHNSTGILTTTSSVLMNTSATAGSPSSAQLRHLRSVHQQNPRRVPSMQWLFRSNIPRHRRSFLGPDIQRRNFFGMSEVLSVLANVSHLSFLFDPDPLTLL